ncbi:MAG: 16S rRNA (adenine(1518)-N(6)/adenine(1519)-N(6))-dimethyltransferase RsmA [Candidatus Baltobacteraceae bacterium]
MDAGAAKHIASLCTLEGSGAVVEIGAGTGVLTRALLEAGARVTAVEIDPDLTELLRAQAELAAARIVCADALEFDYAAAAGSKPWCAAGNLPYNIATPLVAGWLTRAPEPQRIVVMVQRDVADRFTAKPGTPSYGSLSVLVRYHALARRAFVLGPGAFYPRPRVDSAVVVLERRSEPAVGVRDREFFWQVVRAGFAYRRKTFANSIAIALGIERARVQTALAKHKLDAEIRAEQLDLGAFAALADELAS